MENAVTSYQKALSLRPEYTEAYTNLGIIFEEQGKVEEAIKETFGWFAGPYKVFENSPDLLSQRGSGEA